MFGHGGSWKEMPSPATRGSSQDLPRADDPHDRVYGVVTFAARVSFGTQAKGLCVLDEKRLVSTHNGST